MLVPIEGTSALQNLSMSCCCSELKAICFFFDECLQGCPPDTLMTFTQWADQQRFDLSSWVEKDVCDGLTSGENTQLLSDNGKWAGQRQLGSRCRWLPDRRSEMEVQILTPQNAILVCAFFLFRAVYRYGSSVTYLRKYPALKPLQCVCCSVHVLLFPFLVRQWKLQGQVVAAKPSPRATRSSWKVQVCGTQDQNRDWHN